MKKWLKRILLILMLIISGIIGISTWQYNHYTPKVVNHPPSTEDLGYFQESYDACRSNFINAARRAEQAHDNVQIAAVKVKSQTDQDLTIDYCYIPAQKHAKRLLILTSGVHGVEGYVGSAVQQMFLSELLEKANLEDLGILLIHGVNPFGFKNNRRVSENNIDQNRNSSVDKTLYASVNKGYSDLNSMLNPTIPVRLNSFRNQLFAMEAIQKILSYGMPALRQAVLQGQYQFEKGVYFGGKDLDAPIQAVTPLIREICRPYDTIFCMDLHTGYGERGTMHLFPSPLKDERKKTRIETIFKGIPIDWGDGADFYTVTGDFTAYVGAILPEKEYLTMAFEFGTLDSQTTFGSIKSLHNVILENQGVHFGYASPKDETQTTRMFLDGYYPASKTWRSKAISDARKVLAQAVSIYENPNP